MGGLRDELLDELKRRKWDGMYQNEIYRIYSYSRSHVSETLSELQRDEVITKTSEGKYTNRIWLTIYFPGIMEGILRVGILRSSEYVPFLSSLKKTAGKEGLRLRVVVYNSAPDLITALHNYVLEVALAPTFTHILFSLTTGREVIIGPVASGGSAVLGGSSEGDNVLGTSESSTMALISREIVRKEKARVKFFEDPSTACTKFLRGEYRYLSIWEPYLSQLTGEKGVTRVDTGISTTSSYPCCSAAVNMKFFESKRELSLRIGDDYSEFVRDLQSRDLDYGISEISLATDFSGSEVRESLGSYDFESKLTLETLEHYMIDVGIPVSAERLRKMLP